LITKVYGPAPTVELNVRFTGLPLQVVGEDEMIVPTGNGLTVMVTLVRESPDLLQLLASVILVSLKLRVRVVVGISSKITSTQ
jgi:hypothetical protein